MYMEENKTSNNSKEEEINEINALSDNKVDVEIEPDVKSNNVTIQICSCSIIFNCFTHTKPKNNSE